MYAVISDDRLVWKHRSIGKYPLCLILRECSSNAPFPNFSTYQSLGIRLSHVTTFSCLGGLEDSNSAPVLWCAWKHAGMRWSPSASTASPGGTAATSPRQEVSYMWQLFTWSNVLCRQVTSMRVNFQRARVRQGFLLSLDRIGRGDCSDSGKWGFPLAIHPVSVMGLAWVVPPGRCSMPGTVMPHDAVCMCVTLHAIKKNSWNLSIHWGSIPKLPTDTEYANTELT